MVLVEKFNGFSKESIQFYKDLEHNNNRSWFEGNRHIYDNLILPQAQLFVVEMGKKLQKFAPDISAISKSVYSNELIDFCYQIFKDLSPIHIWLKKMSERE